MAFTAFTLSTPLPLSPSAVSLSRSTLSARRVTPHKFPSARPSVRMQDIENPADDTPSDTYVPAAEQVATLTPEDESGKRSALIQRLLVLCAATSRGQVATSVQNSRIDDLVMSLEALNPTVDPVDTPLMDGLWTLVYSSAKLFESNPFLMAAATPLLQLGQIRQTISVDDGILETEADVVAFPLTSATVKTSCRVTPVGGERLELTVETTTVTGGKIAEKLDLGGITFDIPVEQIMNRMKKVGGETYLDTYYLDEKLRISRSKSGKLYIYTRLD